MKAKLATLFQNIDNVGHADFLSQLNFLKKSQNKFEQNLFDCIAKCLTGNPDVMNEWLFSLPPDYSGVVIWLAQVKYQKSTKFVWLIDSIDPETKHVRDFIDSNWYKTLCNPLLDCPKKPPFLVYLKTFVQSQWQKNIDSYGGNKVSDFSVFQVEYVGDKIKDDIDQLMPMNTDFLSNQAFQTYELMKDICSSDLLEYFKDNVLSEVGLLTKFHTELHNYGHFVGAFSYEKPAKIVIRTKLLKSLKPV